MYGLHISFCHTIKKKSPPSVFENEEEMKKKMPKKEPATQNQHIIENLMAVLSTMELHPRRIVYESIHNAHTQTHRKEKKCRKKILQPNEFTSSPYYYIRHIQYTILFCLAHTVRNLFSYGPELDFALVNGKNVDKINLISDRCATVELSRWVNIYIYKPPQHFHSMASSLSTFSISYITYELVTIFFIHFLYHRRTHFRFG